MCSRYFLDADGNIIAYTFRVPSAEGVRKRYNIAPTQEAPVIRLAREAGPAGNSERPRELAMLRWGLVPYWAKDLAVGNKMINARAESVAEKPAFRQALEQRRCIIPATGFFEWQGPPGRKQPYAITFPEAPLFGFAGLWERWRPSAGEPVETFAIVTTDSNEAVATIHDRMPVILPPDKAETWLTGETEAARALLAPYAGPTTLRPITRRMSDPRAEGPECLDDAEATWGAQSSLF
jgi:putative SOS response-associated peptidase YedK